MQTHRVHALVSGRVHGVGYRASTLAQAQQLGLVGWVRNLPDGAVELEAEGPRAALEALLAWAARGPWGARVDGVETRWIDALGDAARGFEVKR